MSHSKYTHISLEERVVIENRLKNGEGIVRIATSLSRYPSSVSRELKRNGITPKTCRINRPKELSLDSRNYRGSSYVETIRTKKDSYRRRLKDFNKPKYLAKEASERASGRIKKQELLLNTPKYAETKYYVLEKLKLRWSPEQISGRLKIEDKLPYVSHKAIYKYIYSEHLEKYLRRRGCKKCPYKNLKFNRTNRDKHNISERPKEVDDLERYGDLEGDTIFGLDKKDRILTHTDRKSGLLAASLVRNFNANKIAKQTTKDIKNVFGEIKTITYDNGAEFTLWKEIERNLETTIYFANPYHSWERGRNENANGLIRDFFPKGTDFKRLTQKDILRVTDLINNRPRKRLQWHTPLEIYKSQTVALEGLM